LKNYIVISVLFLSSLFGNYAKGQDALTRIANGEDLNVVYTNMALGGAFMHSEGWGLFFRKSKIASIYRKWFWEVETATMHSDKEIKIQNSFYPDATGYYFGKLNGNNDAATQYMKGKTTQQLHDTFLPIVKQAVESVNVTKYWTPLANAYNATTMFSGDPKVNTDLNEYVTQQALKGLFVLLAQEELKIRQNPAARVSDILKKVFGSLDIK